mmetsp:Transcript_10868/g.22942  ORF Transcript_10868/g.22942 Transcript_10868/m.22942 type:complete len:216 (+) Transcript_10868:134-781(+)
MAKFHTILLPIAHRLLAPSQVEDVTFESFFTHTLCHELCHGIGPHEIALRGEDGVERSSTVRTELQEVHGALEEAKADIVGLWAMKRLIDKGVLDASLAKSMHATFLAGCFRSVRFGLEEAHGKGQALLFQQLVALGGYAQNADGKWRVVSETIDAAVEATARRVLETQGSGSKPDAVTLLSAGVVDDKLSASLAAIKDVPVDIAPEFSLGPQTK